MGRFSKFLDSRLGCEAEGRARRGGRAAEVNAAADVHNVEARTVKSRTQPPDVRSTSKAKFLYARCIVREERRVSTSSVLVRTIIASHFPGRRNPNSISDG